ncbi:unnamed protein product [Ophioblennius macclurei]
MLPDAFGCVVANRFGNLLDDDADPLDLITQVEAERDKQRLKKKKEEEKKNKQKKPGQKESQKDRRVPRGFDGLDPVSALKPGQANPAVVSESVHVKEQDQRGMKRAAAGQRRAKKEEPPLEYSIDKPFYNPDTFVEGRGGSRGRRGARFGGYSRNQDNLNQRGKREFDRHNGTGISPEEKRGGRGPWNWGSIEDAASEVMEVTPNVPLKREGPQLPAEEENPNSNAEEESGELMVHVAMEMSLDEWRAMQEMKRPKSEFNIRKAEDKIPSKAKVIHQSKNLEILKPHMEEGDDEGNYLRKSVNDITSLLDINFGSLGRAGRGGRGRGGRGGQSVRSERPVAVPERDELAPNPDDPEDFPALSAGK